MKPRDIPNIITILRILLVIPIVVLLMREEYHTVLLVFAIAGLSDGVDGFLARRYNWRTELGAILDPLADKLLLMGAYLVLAWSGLIPFWLMLLVIFRDVVIMSGALAYSRRCDDLTMEPSIISKINTLLQISLGFAVIVVAAGAVLPPWSVSGLVIMVAITTLWSGIDYVWRWAHRARDCRVRNA